MRKLGLLLAVAMLFTTACKKDHCENVDDIVRKVVGSYMATGYCSAQYGGQPATHDTTYNNTITIAENGNGGVTVNGEDMVFTGDLCNGNYSFASSQPEHHEGLTIDSSFTTIGYGYSYSTLAGSSGCEFTINK